MIVLAFMQIKLKLALKFALSIPVTFLCKVEPMADQAKLKKRLEALVKRPDNMLCADCKKRGMKALCSKYESNLSYR